MRPLWEDPSDGTPEVADKERGARALWSVLAEAHDPVARLLLLRLSPATALDLIRHGDEAEVLRQVMSALTQDEAREISVEAARQPRSIRDVPATVGRACATWRARDTPLTASIVERSRDSGIACVIPGDLGWPRGMSDLRINVPVCLWMTGRAEVLGHCDGTAPGTPPGRSIALVGSRAATSYGCDVTRDFGLAIADRGGVVVSGGAFGIDAVAHRAALESWRASEGTTAAFLAGGLDQYYPRGNAQLLSRIAREGVLYSEAPMGVNPTRWRFLSRNRLIAAASATTIVVEAAWRSGALSTAAHADALSRPVGAVPGSVYSASSGGTHRLVKERGAMLVTDAEDVLRLVGAVEGESSDPQRGRTPSVRPPSLTSQTKQGKQTDSVHETGAASPSLLLDADLLSSIDRLVYDAIPTYSAVTPEALAAECALGMEQVRQSLGRLNLLGHVTHGTRGYARMGT